MPLFPHSGGCFHCLNTSLRRRSECIFVMTLSRWKRALLRITSHVGNGFHRRRSVFYRAFRKHFSSRKMYAVISGNRTRFPTKVIQVAIRKRVYPETFAAANVTYLFIVLSPFHQYHPTYSGCTPSTIPFPPPGTSPSSIDNSYGAALPHCLHRRVHQFRSSILGEPVFYAVLRQISQLA